MKTIKVLSPAKINVFLEVLYKRDDGFHEIDTVMLAVNLYDELEISLERKDFGASEISLSCEFENLDPTGFPCNDKNLVVKTANLFLEKTGIRANVTIKLYKRIPWEAGLGGGSSNAASVIKALASLVETDLTNDELSAIGAEIGSDVPFFMFSPASRCQGRGEIVNQFSINQKLYIVMVFPPVKCSTAKIYQHTNLTLNRFNFSHKIVNVLSDHDSINFNEFSKLFFNRLEDSALRTEPKLLKIYEKTEFLKNLFWKRQLSGSGSAVIFYTNEMHQSQLAEKLEALNIGQVFKAETIQKGY